MKIFKQHLLMSNKQNIDPNTGLPSTSQQSNLTSTIYPKVSCFRTTCDDFAEIKDWRKRIFYLSDREKMLDFKLTRMMNGIHSPTKNDKSTTEPVFHSTHSQKQMGNTLRRYLYEYSMSNIKLVESNLPELVDELHRTTQQITGTQIQLQNKINPEQVISSVIEALKQYVQSRYCPAIIVQQQS